MSTTVQRNGQSLVSELMSWMGSMTNPEVRIADYVDGVLTVSMPTKAPVASTRIPVTHRELPAE